MAEATVIAVLGAPGTGSAALGAALARRLAEETGLRCNWLPAPVDADLLANDLVVCGTDTLVHSAGWHRRHATLTLLTALHPLQRDPAAEASDAVLRMQLQAARLPWMVVSGQGPALLEAALDAVMPLLRRRSMPRSGLMTRLARRDAAAPRWDWVCDKCDVPECEHVQRR